MDEIETVEYDKHPATVDDLLATFARALLLLGKNEPREGPRKATEEAYRAWHSVNSQAQAERERQAAVRVETDEGSER